MTELTIEKFLNAVVERKVVCAVVTSSITIIAILTAFLLPNVFRAEVVLAPNSESNGGGLAGTLSDYSALAGLMGVNLGEESTNKTTIGIEVLRSRKYLYEFIESRAVIVPLLAGKIWDKDTGDLEIDPSIYDVSNKQWVRTVRPPRKRIPSLEEGYVEFSKILDVEQDKESGIVKIGIEHQSPKLAKYWADSIVEDLNTVMRKRDMLKAQQAIDYLNEQAVLTSMAGLREVIFRLVEEQLKVIMLAQVSEDYLFIVIDPAIIPERPIRPNRIFIIFLGVLASLISVSLYVAVDLTRNEGVRAS